MRQLFLGYYTSCEVAKFGRFHNCSFYRWTLHFETLNLALLSTKSSQSCYKVVTTSCHRFVTGHCFMVSYGHNMSQQNMTSAIGNWLILAECRIWMWAIRISETSPASLEESKVLREKADFATSQAPVAPDGFRNEHFVSIRINPYRHGKIWKNDETIKRLT